MIIAYVMQSCPDCTLVKNEAPNYANLKIIDIGEHVRNLKQFLLLRDTHQAFANIRQSGKVGIPCFVLEDESIFFSYDEVKELLVTSSTATESNFIISTEGESCSIDGTGC